MTHPTNLDACGHADAISETSIRSQDCWTGMRKSLQTPANQSGSQVVSRLRSHKRYAVSSYEISEGFLEASEKNNSRERHRSAFCSGMLLFDLRHAVLSPSGGRIKYNSGKESIRILREFSIVGATWPQMVQRFACRRRSNTIN